MRNETLATKVVIIDSNTHVEKVSNEQRINRNRLQEELNIQQIESFSFEKYQKSPEEIKLLKEFKHKCRNVKLSKPISFEEFKNVWRKTINK